MYFWLLEVLRYSDHQVRCDCQSVSLSPFAAETDELMNLNRRMKEENDKHKAEMEELERRQMELQSQHENEEKAVDENLQAEREERKRKLEAAQNEVEDLRQRVEKCKQQVGSMSATRCDAWVHRKTLRGARALALRFNARFTRIVHSASCCLSSPRCSIMVERTALDGCAVRMNQWSSHEREKS